MGTGAALHCSTGVAGYSPWLYASFLSGTGGTRFEAETWSLHPSYLTNTTSAPALPAPSLSLRLPMCRAAKMAETESEIGG